MTPADEFDHWTNTGGSTDAAAKARAAGPAALIVQTIDDVEPLGDQLGIMAKQNVPDALMDVLFGQPDPTPAEIAAAGGDAAAVPPLQTYAILDAAKIKGLPETITGWGLENRCLYQGQAFDRLSDVAPWIVRLTPDSSFTRHLFTQGEARWHLWDAEAGIFLRSRGTIDQLWKHFRKFTVLRNDEGDTRYFRFYDPRAAAMYFGGIADWPERVAQFFQPQTDFAVQAIIAVPSDTPASVFIPAPDAKNPDTLPAFTKLTARDAKIIADGTMRRFRLELKAWLLRYDKPRFGPFEPAQLDAIVEHAIREGEALGLTFKEEITYLLYIMCHFGGWFHRSNRFPELVRIFKHEGQDRMSFLARAFPEEYARHYGNGITVFALWKALMAELEADLAPSGGPRALTKAKTGTLLNRASQHLGEDDRTRLGAFLKQTASEHIAAGIATEPGQCMAQILSYVIGYRFAADPLFPWAIAAMKDAATPDDAMAAIGAYAIKRAQRINVPTGAEG
jgi:Domain of unknown function (DUF4123)